MLSVIVPIYNGAHVLRRTIPAMLAQKEPTEWVFVDDGSSDGTRSVLETLLGQSKAGSPEQPTHILAHKNNRGRGAARNTGLKAAKGDIVVFLDADAAPQPGFLTELRRALERDGAVAAVGRLEMVADGVANAFTRYTMSPRRGPSKHHALRAAPWKYFLTTASCVRADTIRQIGGFSETITYGEDLELAVRMAQINPSGLRYAPDAMAWLYDIGDLETAMAKMHEFGRNNLPKMIEAYPELAQWTGVDLVDSANRPSLRSLAAHAILRPGIAKTVQSILPYLPGRASNPAVRFLLGYTLATSYQEGLNALRTDQKPI